MNKDLRDFRRTSGWAAFQRECRLASDCGRMVKAYRVPGTPEAGREAMFQHLWREHQKALSVGKGKSPTS